MEVVGVIGAAAGIIAEGIRLSNALSVCVDHFQHAEKEVKLIADDVKDTVIVLKQIAENLELVKETKICKKDFYDALKQNIDECNGVFEDIRTSLPSSVRENQVADEPVDLRNRDRLRWSFQQSRAELHQKQLDRQRTKLGLKLQVMRYTREAQQRQATEKDNVLNLQIERSKIRTLKLEVVAAEQRCELYKQTMPELKIEHTAKSKEDQAETDDSVRAIRGGKSTKSGNGARSLRQRAKHHRHPKSARENRSSSSRKHGKSTHFVISDSETSKNASSSSSEDSSSHPRHHKHVTHAAHSQPSQHSANAHKMTENAGEGSSSQADSMSAYKDASKSDRDQSEAPGPPHSTPPENPKAENDTMAANESTLVVEKLESKPQHVAMRKGTAKSPMSRLKSTIRRFRSNKEAESAQGFLVGPASEQSPVVHRAQEKFPRILRKSTSEGRSGKMQGQIEKSQSIRAENAAATPKPTNQTHGPLANDPRQVIPNEAATTSPAFAMYSPSEAERIRESWWRMNGLEGEVRTVEGMNLPVRMGMNSLVLLNQRALECWVIRRCIKPNDYPGSWGTSNRFFLSLDESDLRDMISKFEKKHKTVLKAYNRLTSDQQRQITFLLTQRRINDVNPSLWIIKAVERYPKRSKPVASDSLQVVIERQPFSQHPGPSLWSPRLEQGQVNSGAALPPLANDHGQASHHQRPGQIHQGHPQHAQVRSTPHSRNAFGYGSHQARPKIVNISNSTQPQHRKQNLPPSDTSDADGSAIVDLWTTSSDSSSDSEARRASFTNSTERPKLRWRQAGVENRMPWEKPSIKAKTSRKNSHHSRARRFNPKFNDDSDDSLSDRGLQPTHRIQRKGSDGQRKLSSGEASVESLLAKWTALETSGGTGTLEERSKQKMPKTVYKTTAKKFHNVFPPKYSRSRDKMT